MYNLQVETYYGKYTPHVHTRTRFFMPSRCNEAEGCHDPNRIHIEQLVLSLPRIHAHLQIPHYLHRKISVIVDTTQASIPMFKSVNKAWSYFWNIFVGVSVFVWVRVYVFSKVDRNWCTISSKSCAELGHWVGSVVSAVSVPNSDFRFPTQSSTFCRLGL